MKKFALAYWLFTILPALAFGQNIYDFDHSLKFADHLISSRDYEKAVKEYERLLFFSPGTDSIIFLLSKSYFLSGKYDKTIALLDSTGKGKDHNSSRLYLDALLLSDKFENAISFSQTCKNLLEDEKKSIYPRTLILSGNIKKIKKENPEDKITNQREKLVFEKAIEFKQKIPAIALGLSVIPGLGKVYSKNYSDAAMSFLAVSLCSFLAWRGFDKKGIYSAPGWFYGGLGAGLYFGNFYGAIKAAKNHNKWFREKIKAEMHEIIVSEN